MASTLEVKLEPVERIDRMIMSQEARVKATLREIDRRRTALDEQSRRATQNFVENANFQVIAPRKRAKILASAA